MIPVVKHYTVELLDPRICSDGSFPSTITYKEGDLYQGIRLQMPIAYPQILVGCSSLGLGGRDALLAAYRELSVVPDCCTNNYPVRVFRTDTVFGHYS